MNITARIYHLTDCIERMPWTIVPLILLALAIVGYVEHAA